MLKIDPEFKALIPPLTTEEFEQLEKNIIAEGIREPIITCWGNTIIDGHNRFEIAQKHGLEYETIDKMFYSRDEVVEWMILNQFGRRNLDNYQRSLLALRLKPMFEEKAREVKEQNLTQNDKPERQISVGRTDEKLSKIAGVSRDTIQKVQKIEEKAPEKVKEQIKSGDISINEAYKQVRKLEKAEAIEKIKTDTNEMPSNITLYNEDLFDAIDKIPDFSIDLLNTDPPYNILDNDWDTFESKKAFLEFTEKWLKAIMPKIKDTGRAYISISQWYQYDFYEILKKNDFFGFTFKQNIIWYYKNNNQPSNRKEYRYMFEPIFYLYGKNADVLNFTPDTYGETQQNVWEIATPQSNFKEGKFHSAQKPLELYRRIIATGSKESDTVLDCFAGSGTTGIICSELKRNCILIEKDIENAQIIRGRLNGLAR